MSYLEKFDVVWCGEDDQLLPDRPTKVNTNFAMGQRGINEATIAKPTRPYNMTRRDYKRKLREIRQILDA